MKAAQATKQPQAAPTSSTTYEITAYTSGYESTQKQPGDPGYGITASGTQATEGRTVACSQDIPFGTIVTIEGVGARVCEDRGGAITPGHIDLFFDDVATAIQFGRQKRKVEFK